MILSLSADIIVVGLQGIKQLQKLGMGLWREDRHGVGVSVGVVWVFEVVYDKGEEFRGGGAGASPGHWTRRTRTWRKSVLEAEVSMWGHSTKLVVLCFRGRRMLSLVEKFWVEIKCRPTPRAVCVGLQPRRPQPPHL